MFVKICGLTSAEAVEAAVTAGADALGFVFAASPRRISPARARDLCAGVPDAVLRVAVMRHPAAAEWDEVQRVFAPDWLQTDAADFDALRLEAAVRRVPVYRDTEAEAVLAASEDLVVFEAHDSGRGIRADWALARQLGERTRVILAGGLDPDNVQQAIGQARPWGVDVSSGVESRRGIKDPARIAAFVAAARQAEQTHAD